MSHKSPFTISNEHNRIIHYRKASPSGSKVKSGILERYTYKSDTGELLSSTSYDTSNNKPTAMRNNTLNNVSSISELRIGSNLPRNLPRKASLPVRLETQPQDSDKVLFKCKTSVNGKNVQLNTVRTEHCDSTTDVDIISKSKTPCVELPSASKIDSDNEDFEVCHFSRVNDHSSYASRKLIPQNEDSDSDCQIVEVKSSPLTGKKTSIKPEIIQPKQILEWMIIAGKSNKYVDSVHVISSSDSESEAEPPKTSRNVQINRLTSSSVEDYKGVDSISNKSPIVLVTPKPDEEYSKSPLFSDSDDDCLLESKVEDTQQEPSVYEISDGIKIVLPPKSRTSSVHTTPVKNQTPVINNNLLYLSPKKTKETDSTKPRIEILSHIVVSPTVSNLLSKPSTYESDDSTAVSSSERQTKSNCNIITVTKDSKVLQDNDKNVQNSYKEVQTTYKEVIQTTTKVDKLSSPTSSKQQKCDATLSPESMKSEFYSYLKINTNPSAQKAETIIQNRRSIRVRNLITQNEKLREKNESKMESEQKIQKINEVRKKFLKYSKSNIHFPTPVLEHNIHEDFDSHIKIYFKEEGIGPYSKRKDIQNGARKDNFPLKMSKDKYNSLNVKDTKSYYKRKLLYKKIFITQAKEAERKIHKNKENLFFKRKELLKSKSTLKKHKTNRVLRNRRITRHTLALEDYKNLKRKLLKSQKVKIKTKNRKKELKPNIKHLSDDDEIKGPEKELKESKSPETILASEEIEKVLPVTDSVTKNRKKDLSDGEMRTSKKPKMSPASFKGLFLNQTVSEQNVAEKIDSIPNCTCDEPTEPSCSDNKEASQLSLSPLDKFDLLTKTFMAENAMYENDYCIDSPAPNTQPNYYSDNVESSDKPTTSISSVSSEDDQQSSDRKTSPFENCLGFKLDDNIYKIRKNMQSILSNMGMPIVVLHREKSIENLSSAICKDISDDICIENDACTESNICNESDIVSTKSDIVCCENDIDCCKSDIVCSKSDIVCSNSDIVCSNSDIVCSKSDIVCPENDLDISYSDEIETETELTHTPTKSSTPPAESEEEASNECEENMVAVYDNKEQCVSPEVFNSETVKCDGVTNYIPLNPNIKTKSFHHSLIHTPSKRKSNDSVSKSDPLYSINSIFSLSDSAESEEEKSNPDKTIIKRARTHEIDIKKYNGPVFNAYYVNCTLIIVQELLISFWKQTPLGNVLGAQNMWYSIGNIKRLMLERGCINRRSSEMVLNVDGSVAYIELWTKEHQSDFRERPIADVFATVYFHRGHGTPDKQVLQLENIKGYGNDVRFAVMKNSKEIVVSWYDTYSKPTKTIIRSYQLAPDFQTIASTKEMESVEHYVLSLHNIGNCDTLVLGAGKEQICVWNLSHGWLSTTVSFAVEPSLQIHSMCLWAQCETGYLFLLQQIGRGMLRLVAINGVSSQWKQLQLYHVPACYESLLGVTIESGILMTCYTNGFLCYDMQSGELLTDTETPINRIILPSDKFLVSIDDYQVSVKHVMVYVLEN